MEETKNGVNNISNTIDSASISRSVPTSSDSTNTLKVGGLNKKSNPFVKSKLDLFLIFMIFLFGAILIFFIRRMRNIEKNVQRLNKSISSQIKSTDINDAVKFYIQNNSDQIRSNMFPTHNQQQIMQNNTQNSLPQPSQFQPNSTVRPFGIINNATHISHGQNPFIGSMPPGIPPQFSWQNSIPIPAQQRYSYPPQQQQSHSSNQTGQTKNVICENNECRLESNSGVCVNQPNIIAQTTNEKDSKSNIKSELTGDEKNNQEYPFFFEMQKSPTNSDERNPDNDLDDMITNTLNAINGQSDRKSENTNVKNDIDTVSPTHRQTTIDGYLKDLLSRGSERLADCGIPTFGVSVVEICDFSDRSKYGHTINEFQTSNRDSDININGNDGDGDGLSNFVAFQPFIETLANINTCNANTLENLIFNQARKQNQRPNKSNVVVEEIIEPPQVDEKNFEEIENVSKQEESIEEKEK